MSKSTARTFVRRRWYVLAGMIALTTLTFASGCQHCGETEPAEEPPPAVDAAHSVGVLLDPASPRAKLLAQLSLNTETSPDVMQAISDGRHRVVVADATPGALKALVANTQALRAFTQKGGWLMLWGLTPEGLADFNSLVGVDHLIRPFTVEGVRLPKNPDPLLAGADPYDLLMLNGVGMQGAPLRSGDVWSYVLDGDDIAPFSAIPPSSYWRPGSVTAPGSDQYPPNLVNGMDEGWQLGFTIPTDKPEYLKWTFTFPRPETVTRFSLTPDNLYKKITRIRLSFPGGTAQPIEYDVDPDEFLRQDFSVPSILASGVTLEILKMTDNAVGVTGIRNVEITVKRSDDFNRKSRPLLSIGVLNKYPMGQGGVIVNEMNVTDGESNVNRVMQQAILGVLMGNLLDKTTGRPIQTPAPAANPQVVAEDAVAVDSFTQADELDDTEAIRRAICHAVKHKLSRVVFSPRAYFSRAPIDVPNANNLLLLGSSSASNANGQPATSIEFIVPNRFFAAHCPKLFGGLATQNILLADADTVGESAFHLPRIFGDHMVLQRERSVPVWGWAGKFEPVTVKFGGQEKHATADEKGRWIVELDPMKADKTPRIMTISGKSSVKARINDVLVGEVWVCSGQSNMNFRLDDVLNASEEEAASVKFPIRYLTVPYAYTTVPYQDLDVRWNQGDCSGVAYFFARELSKSLDVPVGLFQSALDGTNIQPWTSRDAYANVPELKELAAKVEPSFYDGMIYPLAPYAIRGAIWYQGEANGGEGEIYHHRMEALIGGWRQLWKQGDFPFYFVQLENWLITDPSRTDMISDPNRPEMGDGFARVREAQLRSLAIPNTGMAVSFDLNPTGDMHPPNKQDVGKRLAAWALAKDFGKTLEFSGPLYKECKAEGGKLRIVFDHAESGLMVGEKTGLEPVREVANGKLKWLSVAGEDRKFVWADTTIDGATLVVSSPLVPKPVAVRYAFTMNPLGHLLYNKAGLPASPFRTDSW